MYTHTQQCDIFYDVITKFKESFGSRFDQLQFFTLQGGVITGASLRDAKNGCELWEQQGYDWICRCRGFDEQLRFFSEEGAALSNIDYRLTLVNGETKNGRTDADGRTQRIKSKEAVQIEKAEFFLPKGLAPCCAKTSEDDEPARTVELKEVKTSEENYGSSVKMVTLENHARPLASGEIEMARFIFKDAIDYSKVKVHDEEYLPFGLQPDNTAMTPNGEMYFNKDYFKDDFSTQNIDNQMWFMHEMTHVWQYQLGYPVKRRGAIRIGLDYEYTLTKEKRFSNYNMEAQGNIIADYFALKFRGRQDRLNEAKYQTVPDALGLYEAVLTDFIKNSKDKSNLP